MRSAKARAHAQSFMQACQKHQMSPSSPKHPRHMPRARAVMRACACVRARMRAVWWQRGARWRRRRAQSACGVHHQSTEIVRARTVQQVAPARAVGGGRQPPSCIYISPTARRPTTFTTVHHACGMPPMNGTFFSAEVKRRRMYSHSPNSFPGRSCLTKNRWTRQAYTLFIYT